MARIVKTHYFAANKHVCVYLHRIINMSASVWMYVWDRLIAKVFFSFGFADEIRSNAENMRKNIIGWVLPEKI